MSGHATLARGRQGQRGFSLIEVIAAFLIFAVGFGVLLQILTSSLHVAARSKDYTEASLWAQSKLDSVGVGEALQQSSSSGKFNDAYRWTMDVSPWQPPDVPDDTQAMQQIDLYRVALTVYWAPHHQAKFVTLRAVDANKNKMMGGLDLGGPGLSQGRGR